MALDNHSNLTASIISWSHRQDISAIVDDFIELAEAEMFAMTGTLRDGTRIDPLMLRSMEKRATADADATMRFLALPASFLKMRRMSIVKSSGNEDIVYQAPEQMQVLGTTAQPEFFTVTTQLEFNRKPDIE